MEARRTTLRQTLPASLPLRWTTPEQWHLTLKFWGETPDKELKRIQAQLGEVARQFSVFRLSLGELGSFGGSRGGVLWLGVAEGNETLCAIADALDQHPFKAHLTLARSPAKILSTMLKKLPSAIVPCPVSYVDHLTLFESRLSALGAEYHALSQYPLAREQ